MIRKIHLSHIFDSKELSKKAILFLVFFYLVLYFYISTKVIWVLYFVLLGIISMARMKFISAPATILTFLLVPLAWSSLMSFNSDFYHFIQGFFYVSIPVLLISVGYQLSAFITVRRFLSFLVIAGTLISLLFIFVAIIKIGFSAFESPYIKARFILGSGSPACVLSLVISLFAEKFGYELFKNQFRRFLSVLVSLMAIYLFASRTYWVMLIIFIIVFSIRTIRTDKLIFYTVMFLCLLLIFINIFYSGSDLSFSNSLFYKLSHSFSEISLNNFYSDKDINLNYRGYEAYRTWEGYRQGNIIELIFGQGLGKLVDLNTKVLLDGKYWSAVPIIHNGFFFSLLKTGALGFVFYMLFLFFFAFTGLRSYRSQNMEKQFLGVSALAIGISLFMTNFVICGLFNFESSILLITSGFILSHKKSEACKENLILKNNAD